MIIYLYGVILNLILKLIFLQIKKTINQILKLNTFNSNLSKIKLYPSQIDGTILDSRIDSSEHFKYILYTSLQSWLGLAHNLFDFTKFLFSSYTTFYYKRQLSKSHHNRLFKNNMIEKEVIAHDYLKMMSFIFSVPIQDNIKRFTGFFIKNIPGFNTNKFIKQFGLSNLTKNENFPTYDPRSKKKNYLKKLYSFNSLPFAWIALIFILSIANHDYYFESFFFSTVLYHMLLLFLGVRKLRKQILSGENVSLLMLKSFSTFLASIYICLTALAILNIQIALVVLTDNFTGLTMDSRGAAIALICSSILISLTILFINYFKIYHRTTEDYKDFILEKRTSFENKVGLYSYVLIMFSGFMISVSMGG